MASPSAARSSTPGPGTYIVKKGDDIYAIARRFGVKPAAIIAANALKDPSKIKIGQVLHIPATATGTKTPTA